MNLQQTLSNYATLIMDMSTLVHRVAHLRNRISSLETLMNDHSTNDTTEDRDGYQREIVELEIELEFVMEIYNQKLNSLNAYNTRLKALEA